MDQPYRIDTHFEKALCRSLCQYCCEWLGPVQARAKYPILRHKEIFMLRRFQCLILLSQ
jgi:hypothetical protein